MSTLSWIITVALAGGILSAETLSSVLVLNVWRSLDGPAREGGSVGLWAPYAWFFLRPGLDAYLGPLFPAVGGHEQSTL